MIVVLNTRSLIFIHKIYRTDLVLMIVALMVLSIVFGLAQNYGQLLCNVIGLIFPAYASWAFKFSLKVVSVLAIDVYVENFLSNKLLMLLYFLKKLGKYLPFALTRRKLSGGGGKQGHSQKFLTGGLIFWHNVYVS